MHKAIINGDSETGVSIIYMEKALDSGNILSQASVEIEEEDNVKTIENKLSKLGSDLLLNTIEKLLKGEIKEIEQDKNLVTYAYNFKNEELVIDFSKTARDLYNFVRGLNPWPVAYFVYDSKKIKVFELEYKQENISKEFGEIVIADKTGLWIQTSSGIVNLKRIQLEGKKEMDIQAFMNGLGKQMFRKGQILK